MNIPPIRILNRQPENDRPFKQGDTVLIDLWAKKNVPGAIYYDITWVGYIGNTPPAQYRGDLRRRGACARRRGRVWCRTNLRRDSPATDGRWMTPAANVVKKAGYGKYFVHRTGHSIGEETHGNGGNIDNLETRDDRQLMPGCCFSIEPGIYLEGTMAVRTEINMFIRHDGVPEVTGEMQRDCCSSNHVIPGFRSPVMPPDSARGVNHPLGIPMVLSSRLTSRVKGFTRRSGSPTGWSSSNVLRTTGSRSSS